MEIELLARAVIEGGNRFLIAHSKGASNVYLPGGHIEPGEGMRAALSRELHEELGIEARIRQYLGAVEHAWEAEGVRSHEINHCFVVDASELKPNVPPASREDHIEFLWLTLQELGGHNLQPCPLRELLADWIGGSSRIWWASTLESSKA